MYIIQTLYNGKQPSAYVIIRSERLGKQQKRSCFRIKFRDKDTRQKLK